MLIHQCPIQFLICLKRVKAHRVGKLSLKKCEELGILRCVRIKRCRRRVQLLSKCRDVRTGVKVSTFPR